MESGISQLNGNTSQEVIEAVTGTTLIGTNLTITDFDSTKENEIEVLGGDTFQQTYTGKNTFNKARTPDKLYTASASALATGIKVTNTATGSNHAVGYDMGKTSDLYGKTIRISTDVSVSGQNEARIYINIAPLDYSSATQKAEAIGTGHKELSYTITDNDENKVILIKFYCNWSSQGTGVYAEFKNLIVTIDNEELTYEPYVGNQPSPNPDYPQDIQVVTGNNNIYISNKNLFTGFTKGIGINTSTGAEESNANKATSNYIQVDFTNNTNYTLSGIVKTLYFSVYGYDKNKNFLGRLTGDLGVTTRTFQEVFSGVKYIRISQYTGSYSTSTIDAIDTASTQLEIGNQATTYIAHQEQNFPITLGNIELCKIGNYQDKIIKKSDGWYLYKEIDKILLNGTETWNSSSDFYYTTISTAKGTNSSRPISKYFRYGTKNDNYSTIRFGVTNKNLVFNKSADVYSTLQSWKDYLFDLYSNNTPLIVYYELETPTETKITDTTLISQLEAIEEIAGYTGTTYIISSNTGTDLVIVPTYHYNFITQSPSPDRPSDVKVVTGNNNIKIQNKNLYNYNEIYYYRNNYQDYVTVATNNNNITIVNNKSGGNGAVLWNIPVEIGENITISYSDMIETNTSTSNCIQYDFSDELITSFSTIPGNMIDKTLKKISVTSTKKYLNLILRTGNGNSYTISDLMVEYGNQATTYIAHQEQNYPISLGSIELAKIGNYQDKIIKKSDGWYVRKEIEKITFNGTEVGWFDSANPSPYKTRFLIPRPTALKTQQIALSKFFVSGSNYQTTNNCVYIATNYLIFSNVIVNGDYLPNTTSFRNWITNNNQTLYCILETPTETKITDTTLIEQLDAIIPDCSYDGITYIISTNSSNQLAIVPTFYYNRITEGIRIVTSDLDLTIQKPDEVDTELEISLNTIELVKVDDTYQDKIYKEDNKWYLSKKTAKIASYSEETITTPYISSKTTLQNGALVYYGVPETITEITDSVLIGELEQFIAISLDRAGVQINQVVSKYNKKAILDVIAYQRKVEVVIKETDRIIGFVDNLDAVKQAVYHILNVERYAYLIYDDNYGVELEQYIGKGFDYLESTIEQTLREALLHDLRIINVFVTEINQLTTDTAEVVFEVQSIYGNLQLEVDVNV